MKSTTVEVPTRKKIIAKSSWPKKELADDHLEALLFCEFGCRYCSSNAGLHLRFQKKTIGQAVNAETGESFDPHNASHVVIAYREVVQALDHELSPRGRKPGRGKTLVYSQLTDGFSPVLLRTGTTLQILKLLVEKTDYRIRVLTKNAIVGQKRWVKFFSKHRDRFVVGLSTGTLDARFTQVMEWRTSRPDARLQALQNLQDAGVPTFGMLCPVFPRVLESDELERLIDRVRPELCEHVWAEPFNDRQNWKHVRECYKNDPSMWDWMTRAFGEKDKTTWSHYATDLYRRIHEHAKANGWTDKLRFLLHEEHITAHDAKRFASLDGVLLQSKPGEDGRSKNPDFAAIQRSNRG